jgi:hypothetical protein
MIKPTIGRQVWHWQQGSNPQGPYEQPEAATIVYVCDDSIVNLQVINHEGHARREMSVRLRQDEAPGTLALPYCEWMPYQKAVASGATPPAVHAS